MSYFLQQLINGLSLGSVYALMSVGYSLVYSIMNFSNFAHGGVIMIGAYIGYFCLTLLGVPFFTAFILSGIGSGILAVSMERIVYRPLRKRNAPFLYFIISAMGASIFLENIVIASPIGPTFRSYPAVFSTSPIMIGGIALGRIDLLMFIISTLVNTPMASKVLAIRFHSFLASGSSHDGHLGAFFSGFGSLSFKGLLPGLPSKTFNAVGFGFLPRVAIAFHLHL
jgi:branched-subunit amino acid ABC-type transport system permease component